MISFKGTCIMIYDWHYFAKHMRICDPSWFFMQIVSQVIFFLDLPFENYWFRVLWMICFHIEESLIVHVNMFSISHVDIEGSQGITIYALKSIKIEISQCNSISCTVTRSIFCTSILPIFKAYIWHLLGLEVNVFGLSLQETKEPCHQGSKPAQALYLKNDKVFTTGFSRMSERQYALWDAVC